MQLLTGISSAVTLPLRSFPQNSVKQWQAFQKVHKDGPRIYTIHVGFFFGIFRSQLSIESSLQQFK